MLNRVKGPHPSPPPPPSRTQPATRRQLPKAALGSVLVRELSPGRTQGFWLKGLTLATLWTGCEDLLLLPQGYDPQDCCPTMRAYNPQVREQWIPWVLGIEGVGHDGDPLPTAPRHCGGVLQEYHCPLELPLPTAPGGRGSVPQETHYPLPPKGGAVCCRSFASHCPQGVW